VLKQLLLKAAAVGERVGMGWYYINCVFRDKIVRFKQFIDVAPNEIVLRCCFAMFSLVLRNAVPWQFALFWRW
jgi:hypothetical protein